MNKEIVGVIQGSIKVVTVHKPPKDVARVGYVLGLRVAPVHRRKGIGLQLVIQLEEWFNTNQVDYAYMATEKRNEASVKLFVDKLGYVKFRTPAILVQPVRVSNSSSHGRSSSSSGIEIAKLKVEQAELLYRNYMMSSTEFFPHDIDKILRNRLSLGTWVAYHGGGGRGGEFGADGMVPNSWAMVSVWNSGGAFKLRIGKAPLSCIIYSKSSRMIDRAFPCFRFPALLPDFFNPFGFYFMYGMYREGPSSGKLLRALCKFVHKLATQSRDCKAVVTEVGGCDDSLKFHIPHWKSLSCPEDLWCIKPLKYEHNSFNLLTIKTPSLFVDPREV